MKTLVTGTAGFIGFHLAQRLLERGDEVIGIDSINDYYDVNLKYGRLALAGIQRDKIRYGMPVESSACSPYTFMQLKLDDREGLMNLFKEHRFDSVCHLAAQAGVRYSLTNPFVYQTANLDAFLNILEACRHAGTPRLVYASSSSVYGGNTKLPFSEEDPVDRPVSLYAATKKANELMAHTYTHLYGLPSVGLRFFTVYGPWGRPDMAIWLFTDALLKGKPIQVFNRGEMSRDFTYVDDIVAGVCASLFQEGLAPYEIFNLGHHHPEQLMELIRLIAAELGVEPKMELLPMQPGDVPATYADISRAGRKLGFAPRTPISEGIPAFIRWFREYHANNA